MAGMCALGMGFEFPAGSRLRGWAPCLGSITQARASPPQGANMLPVQSRLPHPDLWQRAAWDWSSTGVL